MQYYITSYWDRSFNKHMISTTIRGRGKSVLTLVPWWKTRKNRKTANDVLAFPRKSFQNVGNIFLVANQKILVTNASSQEQTRNIERLETQDIHWAPVWNTVGKSKSYLYSKHGIWPLWILFASGKRFQSSFILRQRPDVLSSMSSCPSFFGNL